MLLLRLSENGGYLYALKIDTDSIYIIQQN